MSLRDIRQAPFCWQAKTELRQLRAYYSGERLKQRATALAIYQALTEIASNQGRSDRAETFVQTIVELTGTSESTIKRYLRDFEEDIGLIRVERRKAEDRVSMANIYSLLSIDGGGSTDEPGGVIDRTEARRGGSTSGPSGSTRIDGGGSTGGPAGFAGGPQIEQGTKQKKEARIERSKKAPAPAGDDQEEHASIIRRFIIDYSMEFADVDHAPSNCTRALNLWRTSGKTRHEFLKDLQQARQTTRKYQGKQAPGVRIESKMAYFFKVLESQLRGVG